MLMYITDLVLIGLQICIIILMLRIINGLLNCKRAIEKNRYTKLREAIKNVKKD